MCSSRCRPRTYRPARGRSYHRRSRSTGKAVGRPLERIQADPRHLAQRLKAVAPCTIGLSARSWRNVRSRLRTALGLVQPVSPGRNTNTLTPAWEKLLRQLATRRLRISVSRFARWCSANGNEPDAVIETNFPEFRDHLDGALLKHSDRSFAALVRAWRIAQNTVEGWPTVTFALPDRRDHWTLPWSLFPVSFRQDCDVWLSWLAGCDLLEEAPFRPVRPSTVKRRERQIRSFASALVLRGREPSSITSLRDLLQIEHYREAMRFLLERGGGKPTPTISDLARALTAIGRHHLKLDKDHLDRLALKRLSTASRGLTEKNRKLLRQFDDLVNIVELLRLPEKLISIASRNRNLRAGALQAQLAVAVEILIMAPIRLGNLCSLDIEQHLVRPRRHSKELHIVIPAEIVKNSEELDFPLPAPSVELIDRYLREFRPRLAPLNCCALFPGRGGDAKKPVTLAMQISQTIHSYTGLVMNPHLFRHVMAKIYLDANPGEYEVVRRVLAHRSIDTTTRYYLGTEIGAAVRRFDSVILAVRMNKKAS